MLAHPAGSGRWMVRGRGSAGAASHVGSVPVDDNAPSVRLSLDPVDEPGSLHAARILEAAPDRLTLELPEGDVIPGAGREVALVVGTRDGPRRVRLVVRAVLQPDPTVIVALSAPEPPLPPLAIEPPRRSAG